MFCHEQTEYRGHVAGTEGMEGSEGLLTGDVSSRSVGAEAVSHFHP